MKKNTLKAVAALLVFALVFAAMAGIMRYRYSDSITSIQRFYQQTENTVDVLGLGTSHVYEGLSPAVLYREYGISAYDLCAPAQAVWNTYYYFIEALKTQKPKAVVFDVYMLNTNADYDTTANAIKTTYGMKWSKNRLHAIRAAFRDEDFSTMLKSFYQYHSRYAELGSSDLLPYNGDKLYFGENYKGYITYPQIKELPTPDIGQCTETRDFNLKHESYFRDIICLAIENQIPLYVVSIPYAISNDTQKTVNRAEEIVAEYSDSGYVKFIDFNKLYDEMGLDYSVDFSGEQHLNYSGSKKFTSYFGSILKRDLELADHRGDAMYESWEKNADLFDRLYTDFMITRIKNSRQYIKMLNSLDEDYFVALIENTIISDESIEYDRLLDEGIFPEKPEDMDDEAYEDLFLYRVSARERSIRVQDMSEWFGIEDAPVQGGAWIAENGEYRLIGENRDCYEKYRFFGKKTIC